jgi:hypothetical protein
MKSITIRSALWASYCPGPALSPGFPWRPKRRKNDGFLQLVNSTNISWDISPEMERYQQKCDVAQENHALILDKSDQWQGFRQQKLGSSQ